MLSKTTLSALILSTTFLSSLAHADIKIGVVTSSTGPIALVGIPQKNTVALLPETVAGEKITYIPLDDSSDPTATVKAFKKLIDEDHVDAIIGPSGSPNAMGVIQFAAESGEKKVRRDENRARQRDQRGPASRAEQDQEHQRGLEEVVVEGGKELAGKQRQKFSR